MPFRNPAAYSELGFGQALAAVLIDNAGTPIFGASSAALGENPARASEVGYRGAVSILAVGADGVPIDFSDFGVAFDSNPLQDQIDALELSIDTTDTNLAALELRVTSTEIAIGEINADITSQLLTNMVLEQDIAEVENSVIDLTARVVFLEDFVEIDESPDFLALYRSAQL